MYKKKNPYRDGGGFLLFSDNSSELTHESIDRSIPQFDFSEDCIWTLKRLFFGFVRILRREIVLLDIFYLHDPRFWSIFSLFAQSYDIREFFVFDWFILGESASEIDLVVPDITSRANLIEEYDIRLHSTIREENSCRKRYNRMEIVVFEDFFFHILE